jgi:monoamine oxidase
VKHVYDVIIVGAGAAGISCAQKLEQSGKDFVILEARPRIGGRVFSINEQDSTMPLELGAEFIHGAPRKTVDYLGQYEIPFYDVLDNHLVLKNSKLQKFENFFDKMGKLMKRIPAKPGFDMSVHDFIKGFKNTEPTLKSMFRSFVEGFHAADLHQMGVKGLKDTEETNGDSLNDTQMFRPMSRYDLFLKRITESFKPGRLELNTVVEEITWEPGHVKVTCRRGSSGPVTYSAKKIVLTVPVGVLKSESIRWNPKPEVLNTFLSSVNMGHVQKIIFHFHERFWENLSKEPVSFLHCGPENYFPTWWTLQPMRAPFMIAWQGGPKAWELSLRSEEERVNTALLTLSKMTRIPLRSLNRLVQCWYTHNWSEDPFARGAYSYVTVDGMKALGSLKRNIKNTIYFAGEGSMKGPSRGTVHGALLSGQLSI